jgi:hypothetical protein
MGRHLLKATIRDKKGRILSTATNSYRKTHPLQGHFAKLCGMEERPFLHAEIAALLRCKTSIPYEIYIERYGKDGKPRLAAPCAICSLALKAFNVHIIRYTQNES